MVLVMAVDGRTTVLGTSLRMSTATDVHMVRLVLVLILGTTLTP